jgi:Putative transposase
VFISAVLGFLRRQARARGVAGGRSAVVVIQRFGAALSVNIHAHALVLDGVFAEDARGRLTFDPALPPTEAELDVLLRTVGRRIERLLARRGVSGAAAGSEPCDPWAGEEPVPAGVTAASVRGRVALGPRPGTRIRQSGGLPDQEIPPPHARTDELAVGAVDAPELLDSTCWRVRAVATDSGWWR